MGGRRGRKEGEEIGGRKRGRKEGERRKRGVRRKHGDDRRKGGGVEGKKEKNMFISGSLTANHSIIDLQWSRHLLQLPSVFASCQ